MGEVGGRRIQILLCSIKRNALFCFPGSLWVSMIFPLSISPIGLRSIRCLTQMTLSFGMRVNLDALLLRRDL